MMLQPYSPLRNYSEEELTQLVRMNPSFFAIDAQQYKDLVYVKNMCSLYLGIAKQIVPLTGTKHFHISNLETALLKLSKTYPTDYHDICDLYGIDPKSQKRKQPRQIQGKTNATLHLSSWGYIEIFFPNMTQAIENVSKKLYSENGMSNLEKAKYAHIFFLFIYCYNLMPYDINRYSELRDEVKQTKKRLTQQEENSLLEQARKEMYEKEIENHASLEAILLPKMYSVLFSKFVDDGINADIIKAFVEDVLDQNDTLQIKEFADLLSRYDKDIFTKRGLKPLKYANEVRALKERIFSAGAWSTQIGLFLRGNDDKFNKTVKYAWNKFKQTGCMFGEDVSPVKEPIVFTHITTGKEFRYIGYQYASSPLSLRISDENELWTIREYLKRTPC